MVKKKRVGMILIIVVLLIAVAGVVIVIRSMSQDNKVISDTAFVTKVEEVQKQEIWSLSENRFGGVAEAEEKVEVVADTDKTIKKTYVQKGDTVKKGDKLFEYDTESTQLELDKKLLEIDELNAEIKTHNTKISTLEKEKEKAKATETDERLSIENDILTEQLALKKAEYNLKTVKKEVEELKKAINNNVVTASKGGKIKSVGNQNTTQTTTMQMDISNNSENVYITITTSENCRIRAVVSETYIDDFEKDKEVIVRSRTDEMVTWKGKVHSIGNPLDKAQSYQGEAETVTKYPVYVSLENQDGIKAGQHFTVELGKVLTSTKDAVELGDYYISDKETSPYVWKAGKNGILEKCIVTLGNYDEQNHIYEIKSGITKTDYIAYPEAFLYEGMPVKKTDE